jgi:CRISPR/Cas system CMR-associated protein Cmr5 small subunit
MAAVAAGGSRTRDQERARHAYRCVEGVADSGADSERDYLIAVADLGAHILRSGLAAALASLQRERDGRGGRVLQHLARAGLPGVQWEGGDDTDDFVAAVIRLDVDGYMLATREALRVAAWLRRAAQARLQKP